MSSNLKYIPRIHITLLKSKKLFLEVLLCLSIRSSLHSCLFFLSSSELFEEEREVAELVSEIAPNRFVVGVVGT